MRSTSSSYSNKILLLHEYKSISRHLKHISVLSTFTLYIKVHFQIKLMYFHLNLNSLLPLAEHC